MKNQSINPQKRIELLDAIKCVMVFSILTASMVLAAAFINSDSFKFIILLATGWLSWTFLEYFLHRFWMHNHFRNINSKIYDHHMEHHKHPKEIKINGLHRAILFIGMVFIFGAALILNNYFTLFLGFYMGMTFYSVLHLILHQTWGKYVFPNVQRAHIHHHGKYPDKGFSFSTIIWDWMFGTLPPKDEVIPDKMLKFYFKEEKDPGKISLKKWLF